MADPNIRIEPGTTVLVSGASGFIGSHLCRRLTADGADVIAVSRTVGGEELPRVRCVAADLSDPRAAQEIITGTRPSIIFQLAGLAAAARDVRLVVPTFESNLCTTVNVLQAACDSGVTRVVLPGSLEEPTVATGVASSPYAMSKWAASEYGRMFHRLYGLPVAIARIFITYGPTRRDLHKLIPHVVLSLLANESPKLGGGTREVDWVHVNDVVDGLIAMATAPAAIGATLDIGSGQLVSIRSIVERLATLVGSSALPLFGALPDRPLEQVHRADIARTFDQIGWRPSTALDDGLASTVAWFREHQAELRSA